MCFFEPIHWTSYGTFPEARREALLALKARADEKVAPFVWWTTWLLDDQLEDTWGMFESMKALFSKFWDKLILQQACTDTKKDRTN
jgi:hypothetical protein